ncbi:hypothetical protein SAVERM_4794 [Streptomyces avermitilis MA-4680 = NBRC 14893]|uniref:Uncharacterized protein n=1 Tax=Streptomyces avermitilis (strain ATCC 31267 / DSM 46492 / JCM 5070 / NBRC 14893 / NCIMB 12804 / NRRL 8165 / MA-4680) TaxID=227882 RepID=Q82E22_STRAW|nr:hypothetical protein SAVERM_4794 [Streptomyces avermitilis MA-4680 = NBRC 14893]
MNPQLPAVLSLPKVPAGPQLRKARRVRKVPVTPEWLPTVRKAPAVPERLPKVPKVLVIPEARKAPKVRKIPAVPEFRKGRKAPAVPERLPKVRKIPAVPKRRRVPKIPTNPRIPTSPVPDVSRPLPPRRAGAFPAGHAEDRGHRSPRPVRHRDAYLHPTAVLGRVAPAAQPDHRVSDLPHGVPPKRAVKHLSAGSWRPLTPWLV